MALFLSAISTVSFISRTLHNDGYTDAAAPLTAPTPAPIIRASAIITTFESKDSGIMRIMPLCVGAKALLVHCQHRKTCKLSQSSLLTTFRLSERKALSYSTLCCKWMEWIFQGLSLTRTRHEISCSGGPYWQFCCTWIGMAG